MCTVSIIPINTRPGLHLAGDFVQTGFRIVCNRDENPRRAPAGHPKWRSIERTGIPGARAVWPMDMEAGGTWIAAAEHGLALSLLNLNLEPPPDLRGVRGLKSRGLVIPKLIGAGNAPEAMRRLARLSLKCFAPFRLIAIDGQGDQLSIAEARWDRQQLEVFDHPSCPACFVSSGLGDTRVSSRLPLFDQIVGEPCASERQDEYHRHTWPDRPEISVLMSRADARTVSITTVEAIPDGHGLWDIAMEYEPVPVGAAVAGVRATGVRRAAGAR